MHGSYRLQDISDRLEAKGKGRPLLDVTPKRVFSFGDNTLLCWETVRLLNPRRVPNGLVCEELHGDLEHHLRDLNPRAAAYLPTDQKLRVVLVTLEGYELIRPRRPTPRERGIHCPLVSTATGLRRVKSLVRSVRNIHFEDSDLLGPSRFSLEAGGRARRDPSYWEARTYYQLLQRKVLPYRTN